ncbi:putative bifunctional dethiobiotin synthetase adenosylmethionine-8-amino-7-oxononanoate aminotransferase protein [Neofusicoccum parvum]|nr:putative bifunctional dethiobiotin synthetase adenosylmethionine-8-amino-7-oxononanoate aminotransferase protein [Neofusicoccum parvum]
MPPVGGLLWSSLRVHQIWGANTDVGKTIFSTILCSAARSAWKSEPVTFLKPVSTGHLDDADNKSCSHVLKYLRKRNSGKDEKLIRTHCIVQYQNPVSPNIAAAQSPQGIVSDSVLLSAVQQYISQFAVNPGWLFCETAGGVHSPGPSGTSQADLYRPLRMPAILVGDSKLGGISATISAFESLRMRGYDVESVLMFKDDVYQNHVHLTTYFEKFGIPLTSVIKPPERTEKDDTRMMTGYYNSMLRSHAIKDTLKHLAKRHDHRIEALQTMSKDAHDTIWYPFTQQKLLPPEKITAIDSAHGDFFQTFNPAPGETELSGKMLPPAPNSFLRASFDGSASWWTQGLGHANPQLTLAAAYAAGRYGHVMFAEAVHAPALQLAKMLLAGSRNPRLARVFYSDNGSTGIEVAVKMALRAARVRYGWGPREELGVLGLKGSYHGDTMGAMDCSEPCTYNEKVEWYRGKGFWFDFPTVKMTGGKWIVEVPDTLKESLGASSTEFKSLDDVFDVEARDASEQCRRYEKFITETLAQLQKQGQKFGALILEPIVLGAGGMLFVDPLFQRTLVNVVRRSPHLFSSSPSPPAPASEPDWSGLPTVFDEVFTGLYRLGRFTSASLLGVHPDVSVHAKLLTGGLVPLATTLAGDSIFAAFASDDKSDALLHGHSYTAHAVGCQVAVESVAAMEAMEARGAWDGFREAWPATTTTAAAEQPSAVWSAWSAAFVDELSRRTDSVQGVWALGSVLALHLRDKDGRAGVERGRKA